jgi:hypothetical protein
MSYFLVITHPIWYNIDKSGNGRISKRIVDDLMTSYHSIIISFAYNQEKEDAIGLQDLLKSKGLSSYQLDTISHSSISLVEMKHRIDMAASVVIILSSYCTGKLK